MKLILWILMAMLVAACRPEYQDLSDTEQYKGLAGSEYQTIDELVVHGVSYDKGQSKKADEYVITNKPGFDGPEVVAKSLLKSGAIVRIKRVLACANCVTSSIKFDVEVHPAQREPSVPVSLTGVGKEGITSVENGRVTLSARLFRSQ